MSAKIYELLFAADSIRESWRCKAAKAANSFTTSDIHIYMILCVVNIFTMLSREMVFAA